MTGACAANFMFFFLSPEPDLEHLNSPVACNGIVTMVMEWGMGRWSFGLLGIFMSSVSPIKATLVHWVHMGLSG